MNKNILNLLTKIRNTNTLGKTFCTSINQEIVTTNIPAASPILKSYPLKHLRVVSEEPRESWVESLSSIKEEKIGFIGLHPDIFAFVPRFDIIHENIVWQNKYKYVEENHAKLPIEMRGLGKGLGPKPWPQKGTGRARHGHRYAPQFVKGGTVHGPRKYMTKFYMLPFNKRILGLISTLSCKFVQGDIKIVDSLEIPSSEPGYLDQLVEERDWGPSVLFSDINDFMPENITDATEKILHYNLLPVYGLNVHSMLKHETLVLTVAAVERIQERLLSNLNAVDFEKKTLHYVH